MKRPEVVGFLKEILRECGESFTIDLVWLRNTEPKASPEDQKYQIVLKAKLDKHTLECLKPIAEKYGLGIEKQEEVWIFAKDTKAYKKLAFS